MKARKKQPAITRRAILKSAGQGFSAQGYAASGIGGIVEASGLTKGALFHHFADKRELALAWIEEDLQPQLVEQWVEPLEHIGSLADLSDFCQQASLRLEESNPCTTLVAMSAELGGRDDELSGALGQIFSQWREAVAECLKRGQQAAWIHPSIQPSAEAGTLISMISGLSVMMRCGAAAESGAWTASLKAYLETLRPA